MSEVVPGEKLLDAAGFCATASPRSRSSPSRAPYGRWGALAISAVAPPVRLGYAYVGLGTSQDSIAEGQKAFESGKRIEWRGR